MEPLFSGHQWDLSLCPVYNGALFSGHQWDLSLCPVYSGALFSGHQWDPSLCPVYSGALFSGHQWDLSLCPVFLSQGLESIIDLFHRMMSLTQGCPLYSLLLNGRCYNLDPQFLINTVLLRLHMGIGRVRYS